VYDTIQGSFHKQITKRRHSASFPTIKNLKYMFCKEFYSEHRWNFFDDWHHYCDVICS